MSSPITTATIRERTWRSTAVRVVREVLARTAGQSPAEIRKALAAAYPFGERRYWPYKVWLSEVARQTGRHKTPTRKAIEKAGQVSMGTMFDGADRQKESEC